MERERKRQREAMMEAAKEGMPQPAV